MNVQIVIPTLDAAATLARTLAGVAAARDAWPCRIVVCDGGSSDETVVVARDLGAAVVEAPRGRGAQLAAGARGSSEWLLFLHADTTLSPGWIAACAAFMASPVADDAAGYFRLRFDSAARRARWIERLVAWRSRATGLPYGDQGLVIKRSLYDRVGGFRPLPLMEDVDLVRRIGRRRLVELDADAVTSAARYERDGWTLRPLRNLLCLSLFLLGVAPGRVARLYGR